MHLLVTRPETDARGLQALLEAVGHTVAVEPLLQIEPVDCGPLQLAGVQALIVTSRNALRLPAGSGGLDQARRLPLLAVGPGTAEAARAAGFVEVSAGPATARDLPPVALTRLDPKAGTVLVLSGEQTAFDLAAALSALGFAVRRQVVYRATARQRFTMSTEQALRRGAIDAVVLMSPRTASVYTDLVMTHGLLAAAARTQHLCLSDAVAGRLACLEPVRTLIAARPNLEEMLALAATVAAQLTIRS